jgi:hypothetical protein
MRRLVMPIQSPYPDAAADLGGPAAAAIERRAHTDGAGRACRRPATVVLRGSSCRMQIEIDSEVAAEPASRAWSMVMK